VALEPAVAVAAGLIVNTNELVAAGQGPAGSFVVRVNVTLPADISAAEGVYIAPNRATLLNVPVPDVDQVEEVALPPITPAKVNVLPEQIVAFEPADAVAAWLMVKIIASLTAPQGPAGSFVVRVNVTEPAAISAALGV
jgi:hypothetical protein